jgi:K(+)-stimulated pyrophosphate-energized sodium pump
MIPVVFLISDEPVGKAAMDMVYEVRRQFREIPGIMEELVNRNMQNV